MKLYYYQTGSYRDVLKILDLYVLEKLSLKQAKRWDRNYELRTLVEVIRAGLGYNKYLLA